MYTIYCATCKITNKSYVGTTIDFKYRKSQHIKDAVRNYKNRVYAFQSAIQKYGIANFDWEILEKHQCIDDAAEAEEFFIAYLRTIVPFGYNIKKGGYNNSPTYETRQKISNTLKKTSWFIGRKGSLHPNFGRVCTEAEKKNLSEKFSGDRGPNKKLNSTTVRQIYLEYLNNPSIYAPQLAKKYNMSKNTIRNILNKKSWKDITKDLPDVTLTDRTKGELWRKFKGYV